MAENTVLEPGSSPAHARSAGFWPVNPGDIETRETAMADQATHAKGELLIGHASGYAVISASPTSVNILGVCVHGGGSSVADANDNVKLLYYQFDITTLWWVIASTGTAAAADLARGSAIDGGDGISVSAHGTAGSGDINFRIIQIDDTYDVCLGHFIIC